jgi:hypothetical protein
MGFNVMDGKYLRILAEMLSIDGLVDWNEEYESQLKELRKRRKVKSKMKSPIVVVSQKSQKCECEKLKKIN